MIRVYVLGIESLYEGEDIEIRYSIYDGDQMIGKDAFYDDFAKPILVTQLAIQEALRNLGKFRKEEIELIINDGSTYALLEQISRPKNEEALEMAKRTRKKMREFPMLSLVNISSDHKEIENWNEKLTF